MRLPIHLALLALPYVTQAFPTTFSKRDTGIESLRGLTHVTRDRSGRDGDPDGKYFHESTFHSHYDGRFAEKMLPLDVRRRHLIDLIRTYLSTMHDIGAETWIMHGSLLGWWWNRRIMPWDSDVDVQVSERSIVFLADYYNMTVHHFRHLGDTDENGKGRGKNYMLEVNPNYRNGSTKDHLNVIDARWIDLETGLFIDITTLRRNRTAEQLGERGKLMCKDRHHYLEDDIFPLRNSVFEGIPVKIPYAYTELLEEEYGPKALTKTTFKGHLFDSEKMEWVLVHADLDPEDRGSDDEDRQPYRPSKSHGPSSDSSKFTLTGPRPGQPGEEHHPPGSIFDFGA